MFLPKFNIALNQDLDQSQFIEFFLNKNPDIINNFPQINNIDDVKAAIRYVYGHYDEHIGRGIKILNNNVELLKEIAIIISKMIDYRWDGIPEVSIYPCSFPVCPRFIESSSFMVTYYFDESSIIGVCAHEMTHLLYFKKLKDSLPNESIDTEYPSKDWLLSEICVQFITNSNEVQNITKFKDSLYVTEDTRVSDEQIKEIKKLYLENHDLMIFRDRALEVLRVK